MKLDGKTIFVNSYTAEHLDEETVVYVEESEKIVLLNDSAALILSEVHQRYAKGLDTSVDDIVKVITDTYTNFSKDGIDLVYADVVETINLFFEASLITEI